MLLLNLIVLVSKAILCSAIAQQDSETAATPSVVSSSSTTSSAAVATHTFAVGAEEHQFTPHSVIAQVGDIIEYRFYPLNHSVVRAAAGSNPCIPYEYTCANCVGWWSGWEPTRIVSNDPPIFRIKINDTEPLFFYCAAPGSCLDGMVGVINPNKTHSFESQLAYVQNATVALAPGEYWAEEVSATPTPTPTPSTSAASSTSTGSESASSTASASGGGGSPLSGGAIAGIVIGSVAVLILAAALIYMCGRQKSLKEIMNQSSTAPSSTAHNSYQPGSAGFSEANYANFHKSPPMTDTRFSAQTYAVPPTENDSYRSTSPPIDERTSMMGGGIVGMMRNPSPPPGGYGAPSPMYSEAPQEVNLQRNNGTVGMRPFDSRGSSGPHELAVPSRSPSAAVPSPAFSFADSESGYAGGRRDETK